MMGSCHLRWRWHRLSGTEAGSSCHVFRALRLSMWAQPADPERVGQESRPQEAGKESSEAPGTTDGCPLGPVCQGQRHSHTGSTR